MWFRLKPSGFTGVVGVGLRALTARFRLSGISFQVSSFLTLLLDFLMTTMMMVVMIIIKP